MEQTEPQNVRKRTTLFCCNRSKFQTLPGGGSTLYAALAPPLSLPRNATSLKDPQNLQTKPYGQNQRGGATIPSMTLVLLMNGSLRGLGLGGSAPTPSLLASREIVKEYNIISEEFLTLHQVRNNKKMMSIVCYVWPL